MKKIIVLLTIAAWFPTNAIPYLSNECESPFYVAVDYLFWKPAQDQMIYADKVTFPVNNFQNLLNAKQAQIIEQAFSPSSGMRLMAGYFFSDDNTVDITGTWTRFNNNSCSRVTSQGFVEGSSNFLFTSPLVGLINEATIAANGNSTWCLKFNRWDLTAGKTWHPYDPLLLRSYAGISCAHIQQRQNIIFTGLPEGLETNNIFKKNNALWAGLTAGLDGSWCLYKNLSIIGTVASALLNGKNKSSVHYELITEDNSFTPTFIECKRRLRPMVQMSLGLGWTRECCAKVIEWGVSWEAQYWWNQLEAKPSAIVPLLGMDLHGDLMFHGLTVHAGLRF